jgi:hypothetical protein
VRNELISFVTCARLAELILIKFRTEALQSWRGHLHRCTQLAVYIMMFSEINPPWPESPSEFYRPSDRRLSAKLVPTFALIKITLIERN